MLYWFWAWFHICTLLQQTTNVKCFFSILLYKYLLWRSGTECDSNVTCPFDAALLSSLLLKHKSFITDTTDKDLTSLVVCSLIQRQPNRWLILVRMDSYYLVPLPSYVNILDCQVFLRPEYVIIVTQLSISLVCWICWEILGSFMFSKLKTWKRHC